MNPERLAKSTTTSGRPPAKGMEGAPAPEPIDPATGQHRSYWVLSEAERAKGFVRPVRRSYKHVGARGPRYEFRDLTPEEQERYRGHGYVKFEPYPESEAPQTGRLWTQAQIDNIGNGCGTTTTMGLALCETYARDPSYYGQTFCCACRAHFPVEEFRWTEDGAVVGS